MVYTLNTLQSMFSAKNPLPRELITHAVYSVKCKICKDEYVGNIKRALGVCQKAHSDAIRFGQCSKFATAEHVHNHFPHEVDWPTLQVINHACQQTERKVQKAFHMYKQQPKMNHDAGVECSTVLNDVL